MFDFDPDAQRFRDYAEGFSTDSPVDLSGREGAPRCSECRRSINGDLGCQDPGCLVERGLCVGYGSPGNGRVCGKEREDDQAFCANCLESKALDDRQGENDPELIYPHLLD